MKERGPKILLVLLLWCMAMAGGAQIWKPVGAGLQQVPVATYSNAGYIYCAFLDSVTAGNGNRLFHFARWNGQFWQNLPTFISGKESMVTSLAEYKGHLYAAGYFDTVYAAASATGILRIDLTALPSKKKWQNAAPRKQDDKTPVKITDLEVYDDKLYAGGFFERIDTTRANGIAFYNGFAWSSLVSYQSGNMGNVARLEVFDDTLYAGGTFKRLQSGKNFPLFSISGQDVRIDSLAPITQVLNMQSNANELMVYGTDGGVKILYARVKGKWEDRMKGLPPQNGLFINDMAFYNKNFWIGGGFDYGAGLFYNFLKWEDTSWMAQKEINLGNVKFIEVFKDRLFVSGNFLNFKKIRLNRVAELDENLGIITGRVYFDKNQNCRLDVGEKGVAGQVVRVFSGGLWGYTDMDGIYFFVVPKAINYPVSFIPRKYWSVSACNPAQYNFIPSNTNPYHDSADFAISLDANVEDIRVNIVPNTGSNARKGFTELYTLTYENQGGKPIAGGKIKLKIPDSLKKFVAEPAPVAINNNVAEWEFTNLQPNDVQKIAFQAEVGGQQNDVVQIFAMAESSNDAYATDNYDTLSQTVENDDSLSGKYIFPSPQAGDSVTFFAQTDQRDVQYLIRFENNTPDTINTVIVADTIDLNLAIEYIQEIGASHPYTTQLVNLPPTVAKGVIIWTFSNINLPPNPGNHSDFTANRGHIRFKLKLSDKAPSGVLIKNQAHVNFDFAGNTPTNPVFCMLKSSVSTREEFVSENGLAVYPNPANDVLNIVLENEGNYISSITDIQGRQALPLQNFEGKEATINTAQLSTGVYFITISSVQYNWRYKFIKQ